MEAVEAIRRAGLVGKPGLEGSEIEALAEETGAPLPAELREVLRETAGIDEPVELDFTGRSLSFGDEDIFPACLPIAGDGFGNHWVVDLAPVASERAAVFFACHDPPVVVFEADSLGAFLRETLGRGELGGEALDRRVFGIWGENRGTLTHAEALAGDAELRAFAESLDERFTFVDLRTPNRGDGFSWGRHGPRTIVRRHGSERLFAYAPPPPRRGLLTRLFRG